MNQEIFEAETDKAAKQRQGEKAIASEFDRDMITQLEEMSVECRKRGKRFLFMYNADSLVFSESQSKLVSVDDVDESEKDHTGFYSFFNAFKSEKNRENIFTEEAQLENKSFMTDLDGALFRIFGVLKYYVSKYWILHYESKASEADQEIDPTIFH